MRKLLTLIFVVFSVVVFGQTQPSGIPSPRSDSGFAQYNWVRALKGGIIFPERDTAFTPTYIGTVVFWRNTGIDSALWVYAKTTGRRWSKVVTLSGGVSAGTVTSIATNAATGITGGTITTSGTLALDTTIVSTRLWRQKGIDSVQYNLTSGLLLKVNISDTALMLNPYLRKIDTAAMLSNYVPISRTITTNAPLFGGGNLSANRTLGADTGRNAAQLVTGGSLTAVKDSLVALIASSGGGTVLSVATTDGYGVVSSVADPTSTPNISLRVDTVSISTRDWRQKGIDSVQANLTAGLALKLNLSDTAAMLSNRLKISDTAFMLMPFMQYSDTTSMLTPYRRTSTKITNSDLVNSTISGVSLGGTLNALTFGQYLQVGASSYDGSVATTITTNGTSTNVGSTLVARDANGDFTARNISATNFLGTASTASTVAITNDITTNATYYPMFSTVTTGSTSTRVSSSKLTYNPSTGSLSATTFVGALTGNATTASTLQTARTINGVAFDGSANITISASVDSSLTAGYGIIGSPFDGSLGRTWVIDTSNISTKANVTGALVAKLNIYDTAAMLSGYKTYYPRTAISAGTGISYNPATGVITNSSPSSGGTVTSVATNNGSGITGGTITTTGTIAADTTILSTKANVTGILVGYTTLAQNALKLNISDTATMLSNYRRKTTLIENSDLRNSAITINGSSTSLGSSISVGTVTSVATSAPITGGTITSTGTIGITQSTTSTDGYLSSTDWNTFNNKASTASVALKLNISDTAAMLSNYRRSTTLIENADLRNSAITINGSSTSLGGSISVGTVTSVAASAGTGISVTGSPITTSGTLTITNTAPDQTVTLTAGSGISVTGTYPNFTVTNSSPSSGGTVTSVSAGIGMSFTTITSTGAVNADTTTLATRAYAAGLDVGKANTSLNNVNGVLSSTYGGAGSVSGILKANGSGVVSAAVAGTDYVIPSALSGYLPLSGGTLTGALSGTTATFSGANYVFTLNGGGTSRIASQISNTSGVLEYGLEGSLGNQLFTGVGAYEGGIGTNAARAFHLVTNGTSRLNISAAGVTTLSGALNGTSAAFSGAGSFGGVLDVVSATGTYSTFRTNDGTSANNAGGGFYNIASATQSSRLAALWLDADGGDFAGSNYAVISKIGGGKLDIDNYAASQPITFSFSTTERMRLTSGGNLLIKTTTDNGTDALQVAGSIYGTSDLTLETTSPNLYLKRANTSSNAAIRFNTGATLDFYVGTGVSGTNSDFHIYSGTLGADALTILKATGAATFSSSVTLGGDLIYSNAQARIRSGGTNFAINNNANTVNMLLIDDATGAATFSSSVTVQSTTNSTSGTTGALIVGGGIGAGGAIYATSFFETSDRNKKDIFSVTKQADGIDFIGFKWKKELNLDDKKHLGIIAQQVEKVIPDAVTTDEKGYKSVNYTEVLLYKLENLTKKVEELEKKLKTNSKKLKN